MAEANVRRRTLVVTLVVAAISAAAPIHVSAQDDALHRLRHWNGVAIDSSGLDHTPAGTGAPHTPGHHPGPGRASRAMAIVHIAMFEAVNAIDRRYESYSRLPAVGDVASMDAAIAQAAHDTLVALFPSQKAQLRSGAGRRPAADPQQSGEARRYRARQGRGRREPGAARGTTARNHAEPLIGVDYVPGNAPGIWRQDPISLHPLALGARWG